MVKNKLATCDGICLKNFCIRKRMNWLWKNFFSACLHSVQNELQKPSFGIILGQNAYRVVLVAFLKRIVPTDVYWNLIYRLMVILVSTFWGSSVTWIILESFILYFREVLELVDRILKTENTTSDLTTWGEFESGEMMLHLAETAWGSVGKSSIESRAVEEINRLIHSIDWRAIFGSQLHLTKFHLGTSSPIHFIGVKYSSDGSQFQFSLAAVMEFKSPNINFELDFITFGLKYLKLTTLATISVSPFYLNVRDEGFQDFKDDDADWNVTLTVESMNVDFDLCGMASVLTGTHLKPLTMSLVNEYFPKFFIIQKRDDEAFEDPSEVPKGVLQLTIMRLNNRQELIPIRIFPTLTSVGITFKSCMTVSSESVPTTHVSDLNFICYLAVSQKDIDSQKIYIDILKDPIFGKTRLAQTSCQVSQLTMNENLEYSMEITSDSDPEKKSTLILRSNFHQLDVVHQSQSSVDGVLTVTIPALFTNRNYECAIDVSLYGSPQVFRKYVDKTTSYVNSESTFHIPYFNRKTDMIIFKLQKMSRDSKDQNIQHKILQVFKRCCEKTASCIYRQTFKFSPENTETLASWGKKLSELTGNDVIVELTDSSIRPFTFYAHYQFTAFKGPTIES